jgi:hypothetical protein
LQAQRGLIEFAKGDGKDTLVVDSPNDSNLDGSHDQIDLVGITKEEVWFQQNGNDLILKILGTEDQMTFKNYFSGSGYKFDEIHAGDEKLEQSDIATLMSYMNGVPSDGTNGYGVTASNLSDSLISHMDDLWTRYTPFHA